MDPARTIAALKRRLRLQSLAFIGLLAILSASVGADAVARVAVGAFAESDAWKLQTEDASGTPTSRLICTSGVGTARLKVQNGNVELFPQSTLPTGSPAGAIAFHSAENKFKVFNGIAWVEPGPPDLYEATFLVNPTTNLVWTDMPSAVTEFAGNTYLRKKLDLTDFTEFRLCSTQVNAGVSGAKLRLEYSTDQSTWNNLEDTTTTGDIDAYLPGIARAGLYRPIVAAARADVYLRVVGYGGNGTADPSWRMLAIQVK